ncbi:MAG: DNA translocase FtsK 4TM domain-containing protein, partial [Pseudomonadota bacterium]
MARSGTNTLGRNAIRVRPGDRPALLPDGAAEWLWDTAYETLRWVLGGIALVLGAILVTYSPRDASWNSVPNDPDAGLNNLFGLSGANLADSAVQFAGLAAFLPVAILFAIAIALPRLRGRLRPFRRLAFAMLATLCLCVAMAPIDAPKNWEMVTGLGGVIGHLVMARFSELSLMGYGPLDPSTTATVFAIAAVVALLAAIGLSWREWLDFGHHVLLFTAKVASLGVVAAKGIGTVARYRPPLRKTPPVRSVDTAP